ncbi:MAG: ATP-dependent metallopeptidase FtsH/Yme1/Tma family protein [Oscillospiraceae bacterium]|nr:ATP-dependent metallopeptidase FtsH/Yme1/Tma family protein [Oscillospiraceae bacterium]
MMFSTMNTQSNSIIYSDVVRLFEEDNVEEFTLDFNNGLLSMKISGQAQRIDYYVPNISLFDSDVMGYVDKHNAEQPDKRIKYDYIQPRSTPWWVTLLPTILLIGAMAALWYFMMRQAGGGSNVMSFGKAKLKAQSEGRKVTFEDVAGADEEKAELEEIVGFLKAPHKYNDLGARIPKGVLLMGPPGTGKTLLARSVAGEAGVPFFSISGSDFVEMFVGVGASRVRDLFDQAKKNAPSIVFIDEIDAVGRHRGAGLGGGHDEREQTLNQLLVEMDGFGANSGVIVIAATNRRDILDPALLRPGRFDRQVFVNYPDVKGREAILKVHTRNKPLGPDVELSTIAKTTVGFTGADLENLVNEAALLAVKKGRMAITMEDIEESTIKVVAGPEKKSHVVPPDDKRLTAFHEAGHAVCTYYCENTDPVHQVSIIPRGSAGGFTMSLPTEDRNYHRKTEMEDDLVVLLGGRVAEQLVLEDISTGASNDIQRATELAKSMVTKYGFSEKLGPIVYGTDQNEVFLGRDINQTRCSEEVAGLIDSEVRRLIDTAYNHARTILKEHMDNLHTVANYLYDHEKIDGEEFADLMIGKLKAGTNAELPTVTEEEKKRMWKKIVEKARLSETEGAETEEDAEDSEETGAKEPEETDRTTDADDPLNE